MALLVMLFASTGVSIWLLLLARRELKGLDQMVEEARQQDEAEKPQKDENFKESLNQPGLYGSDGRARYL